MKRAGRGFYRQGTLKLARQLLGKYLVCVENGKMTCGMIVETEAYRGKDDPGSHAFRKRTPRNEVMFGKPGRAYVYFCYGNHYLFNIVTENEGKAGAVLIRGLEPVLGLKEMMRRRRTSDIYKLASGPAKLTEALGIGRRHNRMDLASGPVYVAAGRQKKFRIARGPRIGIKQGLDRMWRFWIKGNRHVSVGGKGLRDQETE